MIIYISTCLLWAIYATYRTFLMGELGKLPHNLIKTFSINLLLTPYCVYHAVRYKKF